MKKISALGKLHIMSTMTPQAFVEKWRRSTLKESASYQEHFGDICRMLGHQTPVEKDPHGDFFTFQKGVTKNAQGATVLEDTLFGPLAVHPAFEKGFADVWYKNHFAWEYKGKHKDLEKAREQLLQYIDDLQNPPLLVVCDFERFEIHTRFNNCVKRVYKFSNDDLVKPENLNYLRQILENPNFFKPDRSTADVTEDVAKQFATLSTSLRERNVEAHAAAHFLMKLLFCLFSENVGLLPKKVFSQIVAKAVGRFEGVDADYETSTDRLPLGRQTPRAKSNNAEEDFFVKHLRSLFRAMKKGGEVLMEQIDWFNGGLFDNDEVFELSSTDLEVLDYCCKQDWSSIEPSIFGTLFERSLDPEKRSQLGAHYTSKSDIETLVEPVVIQPLRKEWDRTKKRAVGALAVREKSSRKEYVKADRALRNLLEKFMGRLAGVTVLDPACGSGNFLYVALNMLKDLEKEVFSFAQKLGYTLPRQVDPEQLYGREINPYAVELARLVVWIGHIQWDKNNGLYRPAYPILKPLKNILERDAILNFVPSSNGSLMPTEPKWPETEFIVGNPPFLGGNRIRGELGGDYIEALFKIYEGRVPAFSDLCCYWFEKARTQIIDHNCSRAGLLATQAIRGGSNREVLNGIKASGDIFFAVSDRAWVLDGANVHISMVGFDNGVESKRVLDGKSVTKINSNLSAQVDISVARALESNRRLCFQGPSPKAKFDLSEGVALKLIHSSNLPYCNSDVIRPIISATDQTKASRNLWTIDFGLMPIDVAQNYVKPFEHLKEFVYPTRSKNRRECYAQKWWQYAEARPGMRTALEHLERYFSTPCHSKFRLFCWCNAATLCNQATIVFSRDDDYFFGVLHSRFHEVWALKLGTRLETRPRYTPTSCFETFPLPRPNRKQESVIAQAAKELDELRNTQWLNPPDLTKQEILTFSGSITGPWARYVKDPDSRGIGTVHYARTVPADADSAVELAKRTLTKLYNLRPAWLSEAHRRLDEAVAAAYGWPVDLSDDQILERLLELNLERAKQQDK